MDDRLSDYDYALPEYLIAQRPLDRRDGARMMVLLREQGTILHRQFVDLETFVRPGDLLVLNNTRVLAARRFSDDGKIEFLFLEQLGPRQWKCLVKPGRKMRIGASVTIGGATAGVESVTDGGERILRFDREIDLFSEGQMPLPPYVRRESDRSDVERYQTVFASDPGAVAAPTAGLHFTEELLGRIAHTFVTLHVGTGTFFPVKSENIAEHQMHRERFAISDAAAHAINAAQRVIAIGTTTVRVLEAAVRRDGKLIPQQGSTDIFLRPPAAIKRVDALLTNFHLPRSTLLMLVSAFAGREFVLRAYQEAIETGYRFYSYGDCMLIL